MKTQYYMIQDTQGQNIVVEGILDENTDHLELYIDPNEYLTDIQDINYWLEDFATDEFLNMDLHNAIQMAQVIATQGNREIKYYNLTAGTAEAIQMAKATRENVKIFINGEPQDVEIDNVGITWTWDCQHITVNNLMELWSNHNEPI